MNTEVSRIIGYLIEDFHLSFVIIITNTCCELILKFDHLTSRIYSDNLQLIIFIKLH
jgi:hypothetical protein